MTQEQVHVPILIVGAGGAGLSFSVMLLQQGIRPLVIERRSGISWVPRARNLNFRTLEVLRGLGLEAEVHAVGAHISQVIFKERLADSAEKGLIDPTALADLPQVISPEPFGLYCPQSRLEPILLATSRQRGGDVRYNTELVSFTQDESGITATLRERDTDRSYSVRADYLIAADGAHSHMREKLGITSQGLGALPEYFTFVYFRAPWQELIAGHDADGFIIKNADVQGIFLVADEDRGMFLITDQGARKESVEDLTVERWKELVVKAIGQEMEVEIIDIAHWQPAESVADQFQQGRVFLVGDAAHTMPAYKGLGVNTAIQSAQNLAWKLAAVLKRQASPALLATYQVERHPVGRFAAEQSLTGPGAAWLPKFAHGQLLAEEKDLPFFYPIVGYRYRSAAVISEDAAPAPAGDEIKLLDREELAGQPGTRVPHLWLEQQGRRISTLDLFDGRFVLLAGPDGEQWIQAAAAVSSALGVELAAYRVGPNADLLDLDHAWQTRMGVSSDGALLIRPDSFVAWRSSSLPATPEQQLAQVLGRILGRS